MVPALQFDYWQWVVLVLASPVVLWGAWPFHVAAFTNLRHRAATMDTLVSVGVAAAYLWSLWALLFTHAGAPGMKMTLSLVANSDGGAHLYLEVAAAVTTFILAGRYFESRAKRQSGAALRALLDMGAKDVVVLPRRIGRNTHPHNRTRGRRRIRRTPRRENRHRRRRGFRYLGGGRFHGDG